MQGSIPPQLVKHCYQPQWFVFKCQNCGCEFRKSGKKKQFNKFCTRECAFKHKAVPLPSHPYFAWGWKVNRWMNSYWTWAKPKTVWQWTNKIGHCEICGTFFTYKAMSKRACSEACQLRIERNERRRIKIKRKKRLQDNGSVRYDRGEIFKRDGWVCHLCGLPVKRKARCPHPLSPTIDHLIPLSKGGPDMPSNVKCAHFECNWKRCDIDLHEWVGGGVGVG